LATKSFAARLGDRCSLQQSGGMELSVLKPREILTEDEQHRPAARGIAAIGAGIVLRHAPLE
jgi:hypothetical protein